MPEWIIQVVPLAGALLTSVGGLVITVHKYRKQAKSKQIIEAKNFYLETAQPLVLSAERMSGLTGMQRKEYVMTRLENECTKVGVPVDLREMALAVERAVIIMNDHRHLNSPVSELLDAEKEKISLQEQAKIDKQFAEDAEFREGLKAAGKETMDIVKDVLNKNQNNKGE